MSCEYGFSQTMGGGGSSPAGMECGGCAPKISTGSARSAARRKLSVRMRTPTVRWRPSNEQTASWWNVYLGGVTGGGTLGEGVVHTA